MNRGVFLRNLYVLRWDEKVDPRSRMALSYREGQLQTREAEVAEFFQALPPARVAIEVGTHSAWVQEVIAGKGHEVLVANPRLMEGSKPAPHPGSSNK